MQTNLYSSSYLCFYYCLFICYLINHVHYVAVMYHNNFTNLIDDPVLPNLIPEEPVYEDLFQLNDLMTTIPYPEISDLNHKLELLTIDANTHGLRIEVERAKRQRLQATVKQMRQDLALVNADIVMLKNEIAHLRDHQNSVNFQMDNDNARTSTLSFRSLSRISQILLTLVPKGTPIPESSFETEILLRELNQTIRQFGVYYHASHV